MLYVRNRTVISFYQLDEETQRIIIGGIFRQDGAKHFKLETVIVFRLLRISENKEYGMRDIQDEYCFFVQFDQTI